VDVKLRRFRQLIDELADVKEDLLGGLELGPRISIC
jgi:hypothetical protein